MIASASIITGFTRTRPLADDSFTHAGIGLFIVGFFILLPVLGRKKIKSRTIDFLGTLFLLMMFEFITLILHPRIALWTHDNQVTMFLILVGLAGFVIEPCTTNWRPG